MATFDDDQTFGDGRRPESDQAIQRCNHGSATGVTECDDGSTRSGAEPSPSGPQREDVLTMLTFPSLENSSMSSRRWLPIPTQSPSTTRSFQLPWRTAFNGVSTRSSIQEEEDPLLPTRRGGRSPPSTSSPAPEHNARHVERCPLAQATLLASWPYGHGGVPLPRVVLDPPFLLACEHFKGV